MQNRFGLLVTDVMPIYMIIPRYSHNYAQFCQLLNNNSFTHRKILMLLREATSKTYGPRVYSPLYYFPSTSYFCRRLLCNLYFSINTTKIQKIFTLLSLLDLTFASGREGIDNPFIALVARFLIVVQVLRDLCVVSYWIDTLVRKN